MPPCPPIFLQLPISRDKELPAFRDLYYMYSELELWNSHFYSLCISKDNNTLKLATFAWFKQIHCRHLSSNVKFVRKWEVMFLKNVLHVRVGTLLPRPRTPERYLCVSFVFGGWVLNLSGLSSLMEEMMMNGAGTWDNYLNGRWGVKCGKHPSSQSGPSSV